MSKVRDISFIQFRLFVLLLRSKKSIIITVISLKSNETWKMGIYYILRICKNGLTRLGVSSVQYTTRLISLHINTVVQEKFWPGRPINKLNELKQNHDILRLKSLSLLFLFLVD